ncbi:MAG: amino acid ABC transporter permease [Proteobacteria bacterium]|nr:amino acid ABC transporter permease [Pseudomonadota bacterium]
MAYQFDWAAILRPSQWLAAIGVTVGYSVGTIAGGMIIGLACGGLLLSRRRLLRYPAKAYVSVFRGTPVLVQIIWFYYALPILTGYQLNSWFAAGLGLTLYMGAFCAEIFRGGIISIDAGQWDAGRALGLHRVHLMTKVILPQAIRRMVPPLSNQVVIQIKNTALLYVVAVPDLMYTSSELTSQTYRPLESYTFVALLYFLLISPVTMLMKRLETRMADR